MGERNTTPLRPRHTRKLLVTVVTAGLLLRGLGACSPPPTSTDTNSAGQEVTLSWKDYPARAGNHGAETLMAPVQEDAEDARPPENSFCWPSKTR